MKNLKRKAAEELMYWREKPGFPDLQPRQVALLPVVQKTPPRPEVDRAAKKQFEALVAALASRAADVSHLDRIVSRLRIAHVAACPTVAQINAAADLVDEKGRHREWSGNPATCPFSTCDGTGFITAAGKGAEFCRCHAAYVPPKPAAAAAAAKGEAHG